MSPNQRHNILLIYSHAHSVLIEDRRERLPVGSVVYVECERYKGHGIVAEYPPQADQVGVRVEGWNVRHYPVEAVVPATQKDWPQWIVRFKRAKRRMEKTSTNHEQPIV